MKATQMVERTTRTRRVVMRAEAFSERGKRKAGGGKEADAGGALRSPVSGFRSLISASFLFILKILSSCLKILIGAG